MVAVSSDSTESLAIVTRTGCQADPRHPELKLAEPLFRLTCHFSLAHDPASRVHHANARTSSDTSIPAYRSMVVPSMMLGAGRGLTLFMTPSL
jgi:hypothetical protein